MDNLALEKPASLSKKSYQTFNDNCDSENVMEKLNDSKFPKIFPNGFKGELKHIAKIAFPIILTNVLQFTILTESVIMCGHLAKLELDGVALAVSMINAFGLSIGTGLCSACDTLFAQSYGSTNKKRAGMFLQKSIMIINLFPIVLCCIHINAEPIFILLGQDPEVSRLAAIFMRNFLPGIFFQINFTILVRYMQNQDRVYPPMIIGGICNIFNVLSQYVCIYVFNFGFQASSICQATAYFLEWLFAVLYIIWSKLYMDTWDGFTAEALFDWWHFLRLAIPGVGHVSLEIVCFEIMTFISGIMGAVDLGSQSILFQIETLTFMIPMSVGISLNIRVGQYLGGNRPVAAKNAFRVGLCVSVTLGMLLAMVLIASQNVFPLLFTNDVDIVRMTTHAMPVVAVVIFMDAQQGLCAGVMRGCGRQTAGAIFIFLGYYVWGLPVGLSLALVANLGISGLWIGLLFGLSGSVLGSSILLARQSWKDQADKAQARLAAKLAVREDLLDEGNNLLPATHRRTPSQPYTCSTSQPKLPTEMTHISRHDVLMMLGFRLGIGFFVVMLFIASLLLHVYLPRELYWPQELNNVTSPWPTELTTVSF